MAALRCLLLLAFLASVAVAQVSLTVAPQVTCDACAGRSGTVRLGTSATLTFQSFPEPRLKARYISHYEGVRFGTWWLNKYSPLVVQNQPLDVALYTMDNTANPTRAVDQMDTLVQQGNVDFFIGDQSGDRAVVQFPKAQALRRVIVGSSGAPSAQANNSFAFSVDSREGAASIQAMNLFYSFIDNGSVVAPLPLVVVARTTSDGADFASGVKEWLAANPDKAGSFLVSYFTYSSDLLVGMSSADITRLGIQVRDNKIRAIIGQAKSTDQQLIDGVLYNSNLFLDLQAWAYEAIDTTQYNQGVFGYSRWSPDLASASSRTLGALWGQFQSTIHTANADRTVLNQYAVSGFHSVMALAAGIRAANSLENRRVSAALASFNAANPIKNSDSLLIATPGSQFYFSQGQAIYTPLLQQFSCGRVAVPGLVLAPQEAVAGNNKAPYVGGTCYPKQEVIITYANVGEFRLPDRSKNAAAAGPILSIVLIALVAIFMM